MGTQAPITAPVDPFEEAMKRKRFQEQVGQGAAPANPPVQAAPMPAPETAQPPVDVLSVAKLKQGIGAQLTPEEEAALAAEALNQQAAPAQPAAGEPTFIQKMLSMVGLGG